MTQCFQPPGRYKQTGYTVYSNMKKRWIIGAWFLFLLMFQAFFHPPASDSSSVLGAPFTLHSSHYLTPTQRFWSYVTRFDVSLKCETEFLMLCQSKRNRRFIAAWNVMALNSDWLWKRRWGDYDCEMKRWIMCVCHIRNKNSSTNSSISSHMLA